MSNVQHAGIAANEHSQEINQRVQYELNKNISANPDNTMGERAQGAVDAVGNKISEKAHEAKKAYHQSQAGQTSDVYTSSPEHKSTTVDSTIKHAGSAAGEHAQEIHQRDQYELNKNIAQNPDFPVGERAQGAVDALGNKISEKAHEASKVYHQNQAGLTSDVKTISPEQKSISSNIKNAGIAATEHSKEIDQRGQFEMNKNITNNTDLPMGERTQAAFDAVGNKTSEKAHEANKAIHQKQSFPSDVQTQEPISTTPGLPTVSSPTVPVSPPSFVTTQPVSTTPISTTTDSTIKHAGNAAQEHALEIDQKNQYELNKNIASNPDFPMGERTQAAFQAAGNKISEKTHEVKKAYHQNQAEKASSDV